MWKKRLTVLGTLILSASLAGFSPTLRADSGCKGLDKNACGKKANCSWVNPYTRKDGVKVSGYCRTKPGKKMAAKGTKQDTTKAESGKKTKSGTATH